MRIILRVESLILWRRAKRWLVPHAGTGRSHPSGLRATALAIIGLFALFKPVLLAVSLVLALKVGHAADSFGVAVVVAWVGVASVAFARRDVLRLAQQAFGHSRPELEYLLVDDAEEASAVVRVVLQATIQAGAHLVQTLLFAGTVLGLLGVAPTSSGLVVAWALVLTMLGTAVRLLIASTLGRALARPARRRSVLSAGLEATWLAAIGIGMAFLARVATEAAVAFGRSLAAGTSGEAVASTAQTILAASAPVIEVARACIGIRPLAVGTAIALVTTGAAWAVTRRAVRQSVATLGHAEETRSQARLGALLVVPIVRAATRLLRVSRPVAALLGKDLTACSRRPERLRAAMLVSACAYGIAIGVVRALLGEGLFVFQPFNVVVLAACVTASAASQIMLPIFSVDSEGRCIEISRIASVTSLDLVVAKAVGMAVIVGAVTVVPTLVSETLLGASVLEVLGACAVTAVISTALAFEAVSATAMFPRFTRRSESDAGRSMGATLSGSLLQQSVFFAAVIVPCVPVLDAAITHGTYQGISWSASLAVLTTISLMTVGLGLAVGSKRLESHLGAS